MSGLDQRERQAIVDALDRWRKVGTGPTLPDVMGNILGGRFAPKPEPPAGYRVAGIDMATGEDRTVTAPQPDHLAEAERTISFYGSEATAHALIDIAQTLRGIRKDALVQAFQRGGRP